MGTETQHEIELASHQIHKIQAADLRARLACFVSEWDRPEMDVYDNYELYIEWLLLSHDASPS